MTNKIGFWAQAPARREEIALVTPEEREVSFGELFDRQNQLSHALTEFSLGFGDHVAMLMPNNQAYLEIFLATHQSGLYLTPINYHLTGPEVAYILQDAGAKVFFAHARYADAARKAVAEVGFDPARCFAVGGPIEGFTDYDALLAGQPAEPPAERQAGTLMLYTSGTTGRPKGVKRDLQAGNPDAVAMLAGMMGSLFKLKGGPPGVHLVTGPLYHAAPGGFGSASLHLGHKLVLQDKWDAEDTLRLIDKYRVTVSHMVPTMFHRLLALPDEVKARYDISSLETIIHGAAPIAEDAKQAIIEWWGPVLFEYYGATEGGGTLATSEEWLVKPGTVGKPWPGTQVKILGEAGQPLAPGEVGTVYMSSMIGQFEYHNAPEKTAESWRDGLFTVGDVGYLDEDGWLFLCDRAKDMIISGGVNIYPAEIEKILIGHPQVADVAAFGIPNAEWGEEVKAVVQLVPGAEGDEAMVEDLMAFARERMAKYKLPRSIDFIDELPRLDTGKLYKRFLRDPYWEGKSRRI